MARLPVPGSDSGSWGSVLNDFLQQVHTTDGSLKINSVGTSQLQDASVTDSKIVALPQSKITNLVSDLSAIHATLGTNPQGAASDVATRLDTLSATIDAAMQTNLYTLRKSMSFLQTMLQPITTHTSTYTITPSHTYAENHTGSITGSFNITGIAPATEQLCPITVAVPVGVIPDSFRGTVFGTISGVPVGTYTLQAYKRTDTDYIMTSSTTIDTGSNANFALDLSTTADWQQGAWRFGLLNSSSALVGEKWPQPQTYINLAVESRVITDNSYLISTQPASVTGEFYFPYTQSGRKQFRLINTSTNTILADYTPTVGAIRSYLVASGEPGYGTGFVNQCYTYDQAIALLASIAYGDQSLAQQLVTGLLQLQTNGGGNDGGFIFSGSQLWPSHGDAAYRTGAHSIAVYALLCYIEAYPNDTTHDYITAATRGMNYLETVKSSSGNTSGLYLGGSGLYSGTPQVFNQTYSLTWASIEHNLDTWHALHKAAAVLDTAPYTNRANTLQSAILSKLWDTANGRFYQGMGTSGPDTADPLDAHTWGAIWLHAIGQDAQARSLLTPTALAPFKFTRSGATGYAPAYAAGGYPDALPNVWPEGTFGAALAFLAVGDIDRWQETIKSIQPIQHTDGSYPYVTDRDATYDLTPSKAVVGPAWAVLATLGHGIWGL